MEHLVEAATVEDCDAIMALLPRLAAFDIPKHRAPKELWQGDADMVQQWVDRERTNLDVWLVRAANSHNPEEPGEPVEPVKPATPVNTKDTATPAQSITPSSATSTIPSTTSSTTVNTGVPTGAAKPESAAKTKSAVVGVSIVSYKPELLNHKPSAHLEVLAVDRSAEGQGVATALIQYSEKMAIGKGAQFMSLHVFANNERARAFYDRQGFDGELMRYIKPLKGKRVRKFFGKHVTTKGVARSIKKLLRVN